MEETNDLENSVLFTIAPQNEEEEELSSFVDPDPKPTTTTTTESAAEGVKRMSSRKKNEKSGNVPSKKRKKRKKKEDAPPPPDEVPDRFNIAYLVFVLIGIGTLLPWNAYITAYDYFAGQYGDNIEMIFGICYMWPNLLFLFPLLLIGPKIRFSWRIESGLFIIGLGLILTTLVVAIQPGKIAGYILLLSAVCISGAASALLQGSAFGLVSLFPSKNMSGVMAGQGIAGFGIGIVRMLTKVSFPSTDLGNQLASIVYFILAVLVVAIAMCVFCGFSFRRIYSYYVRKGSNKNKKEKEKEQSSTVVPDADSLLEEKEDSLPNESHSNDPESPLAEEPGLGLGGDSASGTGQRSRWWALWVLWKIKIQAFNVAFAFLVTLSLFPGVTSTIKAHSMSQDWFVIIMITLFNMFDTVGRNLPRWFVWIKPDTLWIFVLVRAVFYVLFAFCINPLWFPWDWAAMIIMALFAVTNGYFSSLAMRYGPETKTVLPSELEAVGIWMTVFLNVGLTGGVSMGYLVKYIVEHL